MKLAALAVVLMATTAHANPNVIYSDDYMEGKWTPVPAVHPRPRPECHLVPAWRRDIPTCLVRDGEDRQREVERPTEPEKEHCIPFGGTERGREYRDRWSGMSQEERRESKAHAKGNGPDRSNECKGCE